MIWFIALRFHFFPLFVMFLKIENDAELLKEETAIHIQLELDRKAVEAAHAHSQALHQQELIEAVCLCSL